MVYLGDWFTQEIGLPRSTMHALPAVCILVAVLHALWVPGFLGHLRTM